MLKIVSRCGKRTPRSLSHVPIDDRLFGLSGKFYPVQAKVLPQNTDDRIWVTPPFARPFCTRPKIPYCTRPALLHRDRPYCTRVGPIAPVSALLHQVPYCTRSPFAPNSMTVLVWRQTLFTGFVQFASFYKNEF